LQALSRAQRWEEMAALVDDEMLDTYAVVGTHDEIAAKLSARFAGLATHLEFRMPVRGPADKARLRDLLAALRQ
jgi:alkanesulfonate monooxygenase SsuD/methylene tetrahydromethanopterin reductase-like flavin-dependent oxidoreductase (luciferase family)